VTAEEIAHGLHPVADAQERDARREQALVGQWRVVVVDARGTAREDETLVAGGEDVTDRLRARDDLGVDAQLADSAGDQLRVLAAEIEDADRVQETSLFGLAGRTELLGPLEYLAFGLDRRRDDELGLL
jgi:hypothetical protein